MAYSRILFFSDVEFKIVWSSDILPCLFSQCYMCSIGLRRARLSTDLPPTCQIC
jgi:hypothetical protein